MQEPIPTDAYLTAVGELARERRRCSLEARRAHLEGRERDAEIWRSLALAAAHRIWVLDAAGVRTGAHVEAPPWSPEELAEVAPPARWPWVALGALLGLLAGLALGALLLGQ